MCASKDPSLKFLSLSRNNNESWQLKLREAAEINKN